MRERHYEVVQHSNHRGCWCVETFDDEGRCESALFAGPRAEARAKEYAEWKNGEAKVN